MFSLELVWKRYYFKRKWSLQLSGCECLSITVASVDLGSEWRFG